MKVQIKSEIKAEGNTFEEALAEIRKQLRLQYESALDNALIDDYHHWDKENEGDVDWIPFTNTRPKSRSVLHVRNADDWSIW